VIELVNTSAPDGLLPGTHGFATVAMTRGTPDTLRATLEGLSSYVHRASGHDARYWTDNPVAWHHVAPPRSGHVLSRVAACDFDYTGRTNRLARHWQASDAEWPAGCNAARVLLERRAWFEAPWTGGPRWLAPGDAGRLAPGGGAAAARRWTELYGAVGRVWAEKLAEELSRRLGAGTGGRPLVMATDPAWDPDGTKLLELFADLIDLLPVRERPRATFSTHAAVLPGWVPCALRGLPANDASMGALTAGGAWFDAAEGALHGEELLGGWAASRGRPGPFPKGPARDRGDGRSGGAEAGGRGPSETVRRHRRTARTAEKAVFGSLAAILAGTLGFLAYTLAGGGGGAPTAAARGDGGSGVAAAAVREAETEEEASAAGDGPDIAPPPSPRAPRNAPGPAKRGERKGLPGRLWAGAAWRPDKPGPGESGVTLWEYPTGGGELAFREAKSVEAGGVRAWIGISPEFKTVRLWKDAENRVFWEFESPKGLEAELDDRTESLDWRGLWLGPDRRLWAEWEAETKNRRRRVRFDAKASWGTPPRVLSHVVTVDALGRGPIPVARLWDEAREGVRRKTEGARARLERELADLKGERDRLLREHDDKKRKLRDRTRTRDLLLKEAGERLERRRGELSAEYDALLKQYPPADNPDGGPAHMQEVKRELDDLDFYRTDPVKAPMNRAGDGKLQPLEAEIWRLESRLDEIEAEIDGIKASAAPKRAALKDMMQLPAGPRGPAGQGRTGTAEAGRMKLRLTVEVGDEENGT